MSLSPLLLPPEVLQRYEILGILGEGGMGTVYRARQRSLERLVAIKVLKVREPKERERFRREARALSRLSHPSILQILEASISGDDDLYLVTELIEGKDLRAAIEAGIDDAGGMRVLDGVARALDHAHSQGIVHRDVKPENVFLAGDAVKLGDFGLARSTQVGETLTQAGTILGTPLYLAPEQVQEQEATGRTDQFALGVMAFELLTGRLPFPGETVLEVIAARLRPPYRPPSTFRPDLPRTIDTIVLKAMSFDPASRFETCGEFVEALEGGLGALRGAPGPRSSSTRRVDVGPAPARSVSPSMSATVQFDVPVFRAGGGSSRLALVIGVTSCLLLTGLSLSGRQPTPSASPAVESAPAGAAPSLPTTAIEIALSPHDPLVSLRIQDLVTHKSGTSEEFAGKIRELLSLPLSDEIERSVAATGSLAPLIANDPRSWAWLDLHLRASGHIRILMGPLMDSINNGKVVFVLRNQWSEGHERVRVRQLRILEELRSKLRSMRIEPSPGDLLRRRLLVEVEWIMSRVDVSLEQKTTQSLSSLVAQMGGEDGRLPYVTGLQECIRSARTQDPPPDSRLRWIGFQLDTLLPALLHAETMLGITQNSQATLEQLRRLHRLAAELVNQIRTLPAPEASFVRNHVPMIARYLFRSFHLLAPLPEATAREILSALVLAMEPATAQEPILPDLRPADVEHLERAMAAHPDLVPPDCPLRRALDAH